jgi:hypothetical protein
MDRKPLGLLRCWRLARNDENMSYLTVVVKNIIANTIQHSHCDTVNIVKLTQNFRVILIKLYRIMTVI